jgi:pantoate--beta-alanine ligase
MYQTIQMSEACKLSAFAKKRDQAVGLILLKSIVHSGHLGLIRMAKTECDLVFLCVLGSDKFDNANIEKISEEHAISGDFWDGVKVVQDPILGRMDKSFTHVIVKFLGNELMENCVSDKQNQQNVLILRLLNQLQPDMFFVGEKSVLNRVMLEQMIHDLCLSVEVVICPTVREKDGLAVSSKNAFLTSSERAKAPIINRALNQAKRALAEGERDADCIRDMIRDHINTVQVVSVDAVDILDGRTLQPVNQIVGIVHIVVSVRFGKKQLDDGFTFVPKTVPMLQW